MPVTNGGSPVGTGSTPPEYDHHAEAPLLTNYRLLRHVTPKVEADQGAIVTEGRNFAVSVLSAIAEDLEALRRSVSDRADHRTRTLPLGVWRELITDVVVRRVEGAGADRSNVRPEFLDIVNARSASEQGRQQYDELLSKLVARFDVRDKGTASWADFTDFLAECAVKGYVVPDEADIHQYDTVSPITRSVLRPIVSAQWSSDLDRLIVLSHEEQRGSAFIATPETTVELFNKASTGAGWSSRGSTHFFPFTSVSCTVLPSVNNNVVLSCADLTLRVADLRATRPDTVYSLEVGETFSIMKWCSAWQRLYCGGSDGLLNVYSVPSALAPMNPMKLQHSDHSHASTVTQLHVLETDGGILTASMDPKLIVQEPARQSLVAEFVGHRSAINGVTHAVDHNLIASCGFDSEVFLWTMHGQRRTAGAPCTVRPLVGLADPENEHRSPIVGVHSVPGTPQLLSVDSGGTTKVWDLRTYRCVQTVRADLRLGGPAREGNCLGSVYVDAVHSVVPFTTHVLRPVVYTERFSNYCRETADEVLVSMQHCAASDSLVSATQTSLQTWEMRTAVKSGEISVSSELNGEATSMSVDAKGRKVVVGHRGGNVSFYIVSSGRACGRRHVSDVDIVDVAGYGSKGVAFAVDDVGAVFVLSDNGEELPTVRLEKGAGAKAVRCSSPSRVALVLHGSLTLHVYGLRDSRYTVPSLIQTIDLCSDISRGPPPLGPDAGVRDPMAVEGECFALRFAHEMDHAGMVSFLALDHTNTVSMFGAMRVGTAGLSDFTAISRWSAPSEATTIAIDVDAGLLFIGDMTGTVRMYDVTSAFNRVIEEAEHLKESAMQSIRTSSSPALTAMPLRMLGKPFRPTCGRVGLLLPKATVGMLFAVPGDRTVAVLPLTGQQEGLGFLSLDRSQVKFPDGSAEQLRDHQRYVLEHLRDAAAEGVDDYLPEVDVHSSAKLASVASLSMLRQTPTAARFSGGTMRLPGTSSDPTAETLGLAAATTTGSTDTFLTSIRVASDDGTNASGQLPRPFRVKASPSPLRYRRTRTIATVSSLGERPRAASPMEAQEDTRNAVFSPVEKVAASKREKRDRQRRLVEATWASVRAQEEGNQSIPNPLHAVVEATITASEQVPATTPVRTEYVPSGRRAATPVTPEPQRTSSSRPPPSGTPDPRRWTATPEPTVRVMTAEKRPMSKIELLRRRGRDQRKETVDVDTSDVFNVTGMSKSRDSNLKRNIPATPQLPSVAPRRTRHGESPGLRGVLAEAKAQQAIGIFFD